MAGWLRDSRGVNALKAGCAGLAFAGLTVIASKETAEWEVQVFDAVHDVPRWVDHALWTPMQLGSAWAPILAGGAGWLVSKSWRPTVGALAVGWGGWWLAKAVKTEVGRGRPFDELGLDAVRPTAPMEGLGYVSGHATVAFGCAAVLAPYLSRRWRISVYALATVVSISRMVVGAHLPLDVIGGAVLGLLLAYLWHAAVGIDRPLPANRAA
jgi:undecaprenyl-diphosphatase